MMDWIRAKIRAVRQSKGISQRQIAEEIGVDLKTYGNWETGRTDLTLSSIKRIAAALKVDERVFWDPEQFSNPNWKPHSDVEFSLPVYPDKKRILGEECNKAINYLLTEINRLKNENLALSRSLNTLFDKK